MNNKDLIISKLEDLKKIYQKDDSKKWNLRALSIAINNLKKYDKPFISGSKLQEDIKGIGDKISKRIDEILK
jgi:DNA polymerase/3'-5' exonuclease PolX